MPRRQSFLSGAAILAGAVAVTKVLGALYKIPLGNLLDSQGMAHFYAAYNVYNLLLMLSTAGLPLAASRLVAQAAIFPVRLLNGLLLPLEIQRNDLLVLHGLVPPFLSFYLLSTVFPKPGCMEQEIF